MANSAKSISTAKGSSWRPSQRGRQSVQGSREHMKSPVAPLWLGWQSRHQLPGQPPRHAGAEAKEQVTEETSKHKTISRQISTELTHQQVGRETFSKPYQRRHLHPLQTETTAQLPKQSLNLELGHPPGSRHAVSTRIWERWK